MKRICLFLLICVTTNSFSQELTVASPDQTITVNIYIGTELNYDVLADEKVLISNATIDMQLYGEIFLSGHLSVQSAKTTTVNETIVAQIPVSRKNIPNHYNELTITFKKNFAVIFRAYNDGVAYRIATTFKDSITVVDETAAFNFLGGAYAYAPIIQKRSDQDVYHTSFEELYPYKPLDSISANDYMYSPVLVNTTKKIKVAITESDLDDYPGMFLRGTAGNGFRGTFAPYPSAEKVAEGDYPQKIVTQREYYIARTKGTRRFPWRVLLIARADKELPTNDLVYRLASPSKIADASWIHPGKGTDEWIIDVNLFNVPFVSGVNTATYKYYIDFAKRFGFDRIMMDAGWSNTKDLFSINPNINMDTISAYAKAKGIRLSMWTLAMTLDRQLEQALDQFNKWGVDFIMTDFMDRDDQPMVQFYHRIAKACAEHKIMIMYHGAYPPKGFNRTWPNAITQEGVLGSEYNAWSEKPSPEHNVTLPFTRMLAGPMDYEPGLLDNATPPQFRPIWGKVMSQGTRCHQLAMFVVYNSPMQIFSGNPSQGYMEPAFMELLGSVPTTWDTTITIDASVGDYIITARQHNDDWFIAGMTDQTARDITIPLDFLSTGNYTATICRDGINAHRNAIDYAINNTVVTNTATIPMHIAPGGGFLIRLRKE